MRPHGTGGLKREAGPASLRGRMLQRSNERRSDARHPHAGSASPQHPPSAHLTTRSDEDPADTPVTGHSICRVYALLVLEDEGEQRRIAAALRERSDVVEARDTSGPYHVVARFAVEGLSALHEAALELRGMPGVRSATLLVTASDPPDS